MFNPALRARQVDIISRRVYHTRLGVQHVRSLHISAPLGQDNTPLRKQLKDEAKRRKLQAKSAKTPFLPPARKDWELTVGIEIHARLNTARKLFSRAPVATTDAPNSQIAPFDTALPGAQPTFNPDVLVPAIRAALALDCSIRRRSGWDRKHYFYRDQPAGYQITQYYEPFAVDGRLRLADGLDVGIKQVQLEQDTAKSLQQGDRFLIDYARTGAPLVEIITLPHIHDPETAAAVVRRVRDLLRAVDACEGNMENGDLRADVNVSVRRIGQVGQESYHGVNGLGTRTEIKNLNSFKSVEEAVAAERDRQIEVLESGGKVEGETRGWTVGGTATTRLRGKEGEVDYRYMPDPDLGPVFIDEKLVDGLRDTLPLSVDAVMSRIMVDFDISAKDALTLLTLDDGNRLEFAAETAELVVEQMPGQPPLTRKKVGRTVANWTLHEIGGLLTAANKSWGDLLVTPGHLSDIVRNVLNRQITGRSSKQLLQAIFDGTNEGKSVEQLITDGNLRLRPMSEEEYVVFAQSLLREHPEEASAIKDKGQKGKIMFFVGQMMRRAEEGTVEADKAKQVLERLLGCNQS